MGLVGQMEFLFLSSWGIAILSSTMIELMYTPTNSVKVFLSPHSLQHLLSPDFFNDCCSNWREMVSQCGFDLHFSNDQWWSAFFHMFVGHIYVFFWMVSLYVLCPPLNGFFFFSCKSVLVLCRFWILALHQMIRLQYFFPILLVASTL